MADKTAEIVAGEDIIDVRDIIARLEYLEDERDNFVLGSPDGEETADPIGWARENEDEAAELRILADFLDELKGSGGDEQWRGDWYPVTLVRDSYFEDFARDEAEQLDLIKDDASWPYACIDWKRAARELQTDYSSVEFDSITYWHR